MSKKKIIVFLSSCKAVDYYAHLLTYIVSFYPVWELYLPNFANSHTQDLPVLSLHGKQKQAKRTATFYEFSNSDRGVLIATDVAARGLDVCYPSAFIVTNRTIDPTDADTPNRFQQLTGLSNSIPQIRLRSKLISRHQMQDLS